MRRRSPSDCLRPLWHLPASVFTSSQLNSYSIDNSPIFNVGGGRFWWLMAAVTTPSTSALVLTALAGVLQYALLLIHAYVQDKRRPYLSLSLAKDKRSEDWVPQETASCNLESLEYVEYSEASHAIPLIDNVGEAC